MRCSSVINDLRSGVRIKRTSARPETLPRERRMIYNNYYFKRLRADDARITGSRVSVVVTAPTLKKKYYTDKI